MEMRYGDRAPARARGGDRACEIDWHALARERGICDEQAHALYDEAVQRAVQSGQPWGVEAIYLALLENE